MKKLIIHSGAAGIFCLVIASCGKEVKSPSDKSITASRTTTAASPAAQSQNGHTCGGGQSNSSSSSTASNTGGY